MILDLNLKKTAWEEISIGQVKGWQCTPLLTFPNLKHLFTSKAGDLNLGKHEPTVFPEKSAEKNRETLCKKLNLNYESLFVLPINNSDNVLVLKSLEDQITTCDAVITHLTNIPFLITVADCVPILLYSPEKKILGLVHAGWRGTAGKIAEKTAIAMLEHYHVRPSQIICAIGPSIGPKHYEVGNDVRELLVKACETDEIINTTGKKPRVDLKLANYIQLERMGIIEIFVSELDTAARTTMFYSHRIQGKRAGRQGLVACMV